MWLNTVEQIEKQLSRDDIGARRRGARKLAELLLPAARRLALVKPRPSWPLSFFPQHHRVRIVAQRTAASAA